MKHVLVADDDFDICDSVELFLQPRYRVSLAHNGLQVLELIERQHLDAIVLDLMMPVMDGETVMRELRRRGIETPVILASASNDLPALARSAGATAWLAKPFNGEALEGALRRVLEGSGGGGVGPVGTGSEGGDSAAQGRRAGCVRRLYVPFPAT